MTRTEALTLLSTVSTKDRAGGIALLITVGEDAAAISLMPAPDALAFLRAMGMPAPAPDESIVRVALTPITPGEA